MVSNPVNNPNFEPGKFNTTLQPSLSVEICELQGSPVDANGAPVVTHCVAGLPVKEFPVGTVRLQAGTPDGFYQVLWHTQESNLDVAKFYRIKVMVVGSSTPFGVADIDPVLNMKEFRNARTGEVIPLNDDSTLPINFRIENAGGPTLCDGVTLCTSALVTNDNPNDDKQVVQVQGNAGPIAGVVLPDGWLPPGGPQSVIVTIKSFDTGVNNATAGTQANPCHAGLTLQQFNGCFTFTTTPKLAGLAEGGHQFARAVTVVSCFVLHDSEDPREKYAQLFSSGPNEPAHPLVSVSDAFVLTEPSQHNCGTNFVTVVIGSNAAGSNALTQLASAGWRALKGGLGRFVGVKTAYAVDLGLGGSTLDFSNVSPVLTAQIQRYTGTGLTLGAGATTTSTARIVGTQVHNGGVLTTGIGGLPVTFTVAPGNGTLRLIGSEAPPATQLTSITNTNPIDPESPTSGGGFAPVNWTMPSTPGTYTLTATGPATGGPVTFTATVLSALPDLIVSTGAPTVTPAVISTDGGTVTLSSWTIKNQGASWVTPATVNNGFYLSTDPIITADDLLLDQNTNTAGVLGAGASFVWGGPTLTIPPLAAGTYYVGILVDFGNALTESNEGNNYVSVPLIVTPIIP